MLKKIKFKKDRTFEPPYDPKLMLEDLKTRRRAMTGNYAQRHGPAFDHKIKLLSEALEAAEKAGVAPAQDSRVAQIAATPTVRLHAETSAKCGRVLGHDPYDAME